MPGVPGRPTTRGSHGTANTPASYGEASLTRNRGAIGPPGQIMIQTYPTPAEASRAFARIQALKRRKGYRHPDPGTGP